MLLWQVSTMREAMAKDSSSHTCIFGTDRQSSVQPTLAYSVSNHNAKPETGT